MNKNNSPSAGLQLSKIRRSANIGLYGSLVAVIVTVVFHFLPWHITYQSPAVMRWMLISGSILAVLTIVMVLLMIRKTTPQIRQLETLEKKLKTYGTYISNLYYGSLSVVVMECLLIILMTDSSLPNMYKMKNDLGLLEEEMTMLFGDTYISDVRRDAEPDLDVPEEAKTDSEEATNTDSTIQ